MDISFNLSKDEAERYRRQLMLAADYGFDQQKLKKASVFIAGAGGLGSPAAYYLAAAGVGRLIIDDCDSVELSNLNRQILHSSGRIGMSKSESAAETLRSLNPEIVIDVRTDRIDGGYEEILPVADGADLVIDCLDNIEARWSLSDFASESGIPIVHGGINSLAGQICFIQPPGTACLGCIFPEKLPLEGPIPVIGAIAGVIGSMQALEAVKYLCGFGELLRNRLMIIDGFSWETAVIDLEKNPACPVCGAGRR